MSLDCTLCQSSLFGNLFNAFPSFEEVICLFRSADFLLFRFVFILLSLSSFSLVSIGNTVENSLLLCCEVGSDRETIFHYALQQVMLCLVSLFKFSVSVVKTFSTYLIVRLYFFGQLYHSTEDFGQFTMEVECSFLYSLLEILFMKLLGGHLFDKILPFHRYLDDARL